MVNRAGICYDLLLPGVPVSATIGLTRNGEFKMAVMIDFGRIAKEMGDKRLVGFRADGQVGPSSKRGIIKNGASKRGLKPGFKTSVSKRGVKS